jgi:hypothetical protein
MNWSLNRQGESFPPAAQHRVQWTLGILSRFQFFSTPRLFPFGWRSAVRPSATNAGRWAVLGKTK